VRLSCVAYLGLLLVATSAAAFPGVLVGKDEVRRTVRTGHVALLIAEGLSVVTVAADYQGPLSPMVWLLPVPPDVTLERVHTGKRELITRLEELTAPRYHEFYEMNPCEPGEAQQEWEYAPKVENPGLQVGKRLLPRDDGPVPREMGMLLSPVFGDADSPYAFQVLRRPPAGGARSWLEPRGYRLSAEMEQRLEAKLVGKNLLLAEVDPRRLGLVPGGAELAAIRYWSESPPEALPATLGLLHLEGRQDLLVYVLAPRERYAAANYQNLLPPTNLTVAPGANERLSELHDALTDALVARHPHSALTEFVWSTDGCGEPCPNAKLLPQELLSLGGDVVEERKVSAADRSPDASPETPEEELAWEAKLKSLKPAERPAAEREHKADRKELARRLALIARQRYVLTRLRWHYGPGGLPEDPRLGPAAPVRGGVGVPRGPAAELARGVEPGQNQYQVRYVRAFPWATEARCEEAERWRWGRRWTSLGRSWRKVWTATLLGRPRARSDPRALLVSPLPELGWAVAPATSATTRPEKPAARGCGCQVEETQAGAWVGLWGLGWVLMRGRRRR
jgi:MYXO-CTERM domain-containing protein